MPFRYQLALTVMIGIAHGTLLAANDYTRRLLDLHKDKRTWYPKGWRA